MTSALRNQAMEEQIRKRVCEHRLDSPVDEAQTPLLENMVIGVPPVFEGLTKNIGQLVEQPLLGPKTIFPSREYTRPRSS